MSSFKIIYDGSDLDRLGAAIASLDPTPIYKGIGEHLKTKTEMSFKREESPQGESWKPSKRVKATKGKTLVDTARLKNSIAYQIANASKGLEFGPGPLPYAAIHQFGGRAGRGRKVDIPQRQYIPIDESDFSEHDIREIAEIVRRGILKGLAKS